MSFNMGVSFPNNVETFLMALLSYQRIDELVWIKTSQVQSLIRTGRTGHWLNHSKEHCLIAYKKPLHKANRNVEEHLAWLQRGVDTDVIVAEVRETSRKPDELYEVIERACPGGRKLGMLDCSFTFRTKLIDTIELFGRMHNTRPGW